VGGQVYGIIGVVSGLAGAALGAVGWVQPGRVFKGMNEKKARRLAIALAVFGVLVAGNGVRQMVMAGR